MSGIFATKKILMEGARPFLVGRVQEFLRERGDVSKRVGVLKDIHGDSIDSFYKVLALLIFIENPFWFMYKDYTLIIIMI